jgi:hypothetical protein
MCIPGIFEGSSKNTMSSELILWNYGVKWEVEDT